MSMGHKERIIIAADILRMDPADLTARLLDDSDALPPDAQAVANHVTRELWTAVDNGDCEGEADYAADVAERLSFVYGVVGHRADEYEAPVLAHEAERYNA